MQNRTGQYNAIALVAEVKRRQLMAELEARYCGKNNALQQSYGAKSCRTIDTPEGDTTDHDEPPRGYQDSFVNPKPQVQYPKSRKAFAHDPFAGADEGSVQEVPHIYPTAQDFCALATFAVSKGLIAAKQAQPVARELCRAYRASLTCHLMQDAAPQYISYRPAHYTHAELRVAAHLLEAACANSAYLNGTTNGDATDGTAIVPSIAQGLLPKIIAVLGW